MADINVERLSEFRGNDLADLCDAAEEAITAGGGFGWLSRKWGLTVAMTPALPRRSAVAKLT